MRKQACQATKVKNLETLSGFHCFRITYGNSLVKAGVQSLSISRPQIRT